MFSASASACPNAEEILQTESIEDATNVAHKILLSLEESLFLFEQIDHDFGSRDYINRVGDLREEYNLLIKQMNFFIERRIVIVKNYHKRFDMCLLSFASR